MAYVRECEKKHERVAILALISLASLSNAGVSEPVAWLSQQPLDTQIGFFSVSGVLESASLPRLEGFAVLRDGVEPGRFHPFPPGSKVANDIEDTVGRTSMLVVFACMVLYLTTQSP